MKQTLEKAAIEAVENHYGMDYDGKIHEMYILREAFEAGAEWQAKQSPWHEVSEEPKKGEHICVQFGSGNLTSWYAPSNIRKAFEDHNVIRWAYVSDLIKPTTQSINV